CQERVIDGIFCPEHGRANIENWHRTITEEMRQRRLEARLPPPQLPEHLRRKIRLTPPSLAPEDPADRNQPLPGAWMGLLQGTTRLLLSHANRAASAAGFALVLAFPALLIGAVGIFGMVWIGSGIEMLSMAAD
ncbi:MAG: hypothetical protein Q8S09_16000, partial [Hyphomonas sp.]|nr:hypothetical protein [Hyphomonas sp.]